MGASGAGAPGDSGADDGRPAARIVGVGRSSFAGRGVHAPAVARVGRASCAVPSLGSTRAFGSGAGRAFRLTKLGRAAGSGSAGRRPDLGIVFAVVSSRRRPSSVVGSPRRAAGPRARARCRRVGSPGRTCAVVEPARSRQRRAGGALRPFMEPTRRSFLGCGACRRSAGRPGRAIGVAACPSLWTAAHRRSCVGRASRCAGMGHPEDRGTGRTPSTVMGSACRAGARAVQGARASCGRAAASALERPRHARVECTGPGLDGC